MKLMLLIAKLSDFHMMNLNDEISKRKPDMVGMTSTTLTYKSALRIAKIVKEVHPSCLTVLGGLSRYVLG